MVGFLVRLTFVTRLACMQPEVEQRDVDTLSGSDLDQPRVLGGATPARLERRQAGDAASRRLQTHLLPRALAVR